MDDFLHRTITAKDGNMEVSRTRTSKGFASITIRVGGNSLSFTNEPDDNPRGNLSVDACGDNYEQKAMRLAKLIDEVSSNGCTLPAGA